MCLYICYRYLYIYSRESISKCATFELVSDKVLVDTDISIYLWIYGCIDRQIYILPPPLAYQYINIYIYVCICICVCVYIYIYICVCIYIYIYVSG